jgi:hypothetical protein
MEINGDANRHPTVNGRAVARFGTFFARSVLHANL